MSKEWDSSPVMKEFMKVAAESGLITTNLKPEGKDFVGNPSKETPVKDHRRYEPTKEYNVTKEEDLVQKAHPKKIQVADSMGEGGVVENLNEQQEKSIDIATKMPNGALIGVHAALINELIKIATELDELGKYKEAARIDKTVERLSRLPFVDSRLYKKAFPVLPIITLVSLFAPAAINWLKTERRFPGAQRTVKMQGGKLVGWKGRSVSLIGAGIGVLGMLGGKITSLQEGIREDTKDLLEILSKAKNDSAQKAFNILQPLSSQILKSNLTTESGLKEFNSAIEKTIAMLPQLEKHIFIYTKLEDPSVTGLGLSSRVEAKLNDFKTSLFEANKTVAQAASVGAKVNENALQTKEQTSVVAPVQQGKENNGIKSLQQILFDRGFPSGEKWQGQITGIMDSNTITAAKELEKKLDVILQPFTQREGLTGSFKNKIIQDDNIIIEPDKLLNILALTEKYVSE